MRVFFIEEGDGAVLSPLQHRLLASLPQILKTTIAGRGERKHFVNEDEFGIFHGNVCQQTLAVTHSLLPRSVWEVQPAELCHSSAPCTVGLGLALLVRTACPASCNPLHPGFAIPWLVSSVFHLENNAFEVSCSLLTARSQQGKDRTHGADPQDRAGWKTHCLRFPIGKEFLPETGMF